jgi:tetratricopeptide (TPR) repeat protein
MNSILFRSPILFLSLILILMTEGYSKGENQEEQLKIGKALTYKAMILHNKDLLLKADNLYEAVLKLDSSNTAALYGQTFIEYRLLEMSLQKGSDTLFDQYYQQAIDNAKKLASMDKYTSEGKSLLAGIYMMKIASSPLTAVTLSSEINDLLDEAEQANPQNPAAFIVRGEMKFNTPKMFGGSYEEAAKNFNKAVSICEQNPDTGLVDVKWEYLESLAWLGRTLVQLENYDAAKFTYQKAISIQPDFTWVKYALLPELEKKMQK